MNKQLNVRCTKRTFIITSVTIITAMCLLPLVFTVIISTREYTGMRMRLIGNIDKGLSFYTDFIGSYYFPRLMRNTVRLTICPAAVSAAFAIPLILAVSNLPGKACKTLALMLLAVPSFVPLAYLSSMFINVFSYEGHMTQALVSLGIIGENRDLLNAKEFYIPIYTAFETLRFLFFPVLAGVLALENKSSGKLVTALTISLAYILVRLSMMFIVDYELTSALYRPLTYEVSDTISAFAYRRALEDAFSYGAAVDILRFIMQLIVNTGVFFALRALIYSSGKLKSSSVPSNNPTKQSGAGISVISVIVFLILAAGSLYVTAGLVFPGLIVKDALLSFYGFSIRRSTGSCFYYSLIYSVSHAAIFAIISYIIAYPLAIRSKTAWVLTVIALSSGVMITANFVFSSYFGFNNTILGVILLGSFSCAGAAALNFSLRGKFSGTPSFYEYSHAALKGVFVLFLLGFAVSWCSNTWAIAILTNRKMFPITILLKEQVFYGFAGTSRAEDYSLISGITLAASLPPLSAVWIVLVFRNKLPSCLLGAGFRL